MIPLAKPYTDEKEMEAIKKVMDSGWLASGPKSKEFESIFADYIGVKHAISVNSCTSALELAIQAMGIKGEVIVPSFTFVATANSVVTSGAKPVFAEIHEDTCNIDPSDILEKITPKTEAIIPVHFAGQSCEMKEIMDIAADKGLKVIEDSAECIGGTYEGKKAGSFGDASCFSFFPTKNITTGEGGMVTTDDDELASKIKTLRGHGISKSTHDREGSNKWERAAVEAGYNYRMCDINAAIGVEQMKKIDHMNKKRIESAEFLNSNIDGGKVSLPVTRKGCNHVYQMYTVKVEPSKRNGFIKDLNDSGVQSSVHFEPPVHTQPYYAKMFPGLKMEMTEKVSKSIVTLPMHPSLGSEDLKKISETVNAVL